MMPAEGVITSYYGERTDPIDGSSGQLHGGVDIALATGTEVLSATEGIVTEVGCSDSWGRYLRYRAEDGRVVIYAHLSDVLVSKNDMIHKGDIVALSGNTGASTGPHLHFGIYEDGKSIDPLWVIGDTKEVNTSLVGE